MYSINMFSSKPAEPIVRTTDPVLLEQKAIAFLDKNYTRAKTMYEIPENFYMLEKRSNNGMKKIESLPRFRENIKGSPTKKLYRVATVTYDNLDGMPKLYTEDMIIDNANLPPIWFRSGTKSLFGNSASKVVLGGTRRRKSRRRQRKSYKK